MIDLINLFDVKNGVDESNIKDLVEESKKWIKTEKKRRKNVEKECLPWTEWKEYKREKKKKIQEKNKINNEEDVSHLIGCTKIISNRVY